MQESPLNILFVHEVDYIKKVVFDIHILAEAMSLRGHNVYVLDYQDSWGQNGVVSSNAKPRVFPDARVEIVRPIFVKIPIVSRVSAFVSHYFAIKRTIERYSIDAIVLYSVPTNGLQTLFWAGKFDIPVVFRSIDALYQLVRSPVLRRATMALEKVVYSRVDRILTITPILSDYVVRLGGRNVSVLPLPVDTTTFSPMNGASGIRQRWGLTQTDKVVLFMGTLFNFSGLDSFLYYFAHAVRQVPEIKLLVVGDGEQRCVLENIIDVLGLRQNVKITGFQPYQDMPQYINAADVCLNTFVCNDITRDIFPGKTVQFLACGKPLIMRSLDGVKALIAGEKQGVLYCDTDSAMVNQIVSLLKSPERSCQIGLNGVDYTRKFHSHEMVAEQLESALRDLI